MTRRIELFEVEVARLSSRVRCLFLEGFAEHREHISHGADVLAGELLNEKSMLAVHVALSRRLTPALHAANARL